MKIFGLAIYKFFLFIILLWFYSSTYGQQISQISADDHTKINKFLEIAETAINQGNSQVAATNYTKVAFIYWKHDYFRDAIEYFSQSAVIYQKTENLRNLRNVYTNIGVLYTDLQEIELSEEYFKKSLEIAREMGKKEEIASGLIDLAYILSAMGRFDESNQKLEEAYQLAEQIGNNQLLLSCYGLFADNFRNMNQPGKADEYRNKYNKIQQFAQAQTMRQSFEEEKVESMAEIQRQKAEKRAQQLELELRQTRLESTQDSLKFAERLSKQRQAQIDLLKKDSIIKAQTLERQRAEQREAEARIKQQEAVERNQKIIIYGTGVVLILAILAAISLFIRFRDKKKANRILEDRNREIAEKSDELSAALTKIQKQNKQITKSINYAQSIQTAMLPERKELNKYIPDSFIFFKPRDIVSGDFYWFRKAQKKFDIQKIFNISRKEEFSPLQKDDYFLISAVDCTGHGVPGAFMSMIGYNLLDDITDKGISRPDLILEQLHQGVQVALKQEVTENKDGMDLAFCQIDIENKKLRFAGAKNPLVYIQNDEIFQLQADKIPIGGTLVKDPKFSLQEIDIQNDTYCYIFSDGFIDQFGGPKGRKYMAKKFRALLLEIHKRPMEEQREILELTIDTWMGEKYAQIDDMLVMGFKLTPDLLNI
ncbi:ATP-dependent transcriptional regulator [Salinivirga cyanobacteriivorans]|uniref:ATP-dependent transcriptional regulator n=1 Tax=Salinivirga cyanobacteriivorans TaxID=1307839 RepID=A0A0S2HW75_9BACT|nr:SpoIIE family protein phosphatase [Salinivirga cyanobacteriivorans]ALO14289.1 ATP-dependent transcriptional regulator [Salinivirga cyanobacteriivorans]